MRRTRGGSGQSQEDQCDRASRGDFSIKNHDGTSIEPTRAVKQGEFPFPQQFSFWLGARPSWAQRFPQTARNGLVPRRLALAEPLRPGRPLSNRTLVRIAGDGPFPGFKFQFDVFDIGAMARNLLRTHFAWASA
jgi:hypothetical protein